MSVCIFSVQITRKERVLTVFLAGSSILTHILNMYLLSAVLQHRISVLMHVLLTPAVSLLRGGVSLSNAVMDTGAVSYSIIALSPGIIVDVMASSHLNSLDDAVTQQVRLTVCTDLSCTRKYNKIRLNSYYLQCDHFLVLASAGRWPAELVI